MKHPHTSSMHPQDRKISCEKEDVERWHHYTMTRGQCLASEMSEPRRREGQRNIRVHTHKAKHVGTNDLNCLCLRVSKHGNRSSQKVRLARRCVPRGVPTTPCWLVPASPLLIQGEESSSPYFLFVSPCLERAFLSLLRGSFHSSSCNSHQPHFR